MKKENIDLIERMEQDYPKTTMRFQKMIQSRISEQVGEEAAGRICRNLPAESRKKKVWLKSIKWVAAVAVILACGTTVAAEVDSEFAHYLLSLLKEGDVYSYMQEVEPKVKENAELEGRIKNTLENGYTSDQIDLPLETPLWEIVSAWYDGVTIYFSATPSEAAEKMRGRYHMNPGDHCIVNGKDYLLECPDAESGWGDLSEGEKTGQYHFCVVVPDQDVSGSMELTFNLNIQEYNSKGASSATDTGAILCARQAISFDVDEAASGIKTVKAGHEEILIANGQDKAEIMNLKLTPSILYAKVKYTLYGEDAKERAEELRGKETYCRYYVKDSFGNKIDGKYPPVFSPEDVYKEPEVIRETDGGYSVTFSWQTKGVNVDTESLTFLPYSLYIAGDDGKEEVVTMLDWAVFTVPVDKVGQSYN